MMRSDIYNILDKADVYYDRDHPDHIESEKVETLSPPFMTVAIEEKPFGADDIIYFSSYGITILLYSDIDFDDAEDRIKAVLSDEEMAYTTKKEYLADIGLWETTIKTSVIKS